MDFGTDHLVQHGLVRATEVIDLVVDTSPENESRVIQGLLSLPDQAARDLQAGDIAQYTVVRVADEFVVDLMHSACGVTFAQAVQDAVYITLHGVTIPFASLETLWKMKQTLREKDHLDRLFLKRMLQR